MNTRDANDFNITLEDEEVLCVDVDAERLEGLEVGLRADGLAVNLVVGARPDDRPEGKVDYSINIMILVLPAKSKMNN